ncbi:hypothetical protein GYMLUDRAFT_35528 [Collybiopsis luxurians FD-317 M1]|nr:hypothetical protein GYMLUDRAFT_35528 [Collybiopsis luxurians FD-317 M1]
MGSCLSSEGGAEVTAHGSAVHPQAERGPRVPTTKLAQQIKVLVLGSSDSGKSTVLKQLRLIHRQPFSSQEIEFFRQLIFLNLTREGLKYVLEAMEEMELEVSRENLPYVNLIEFSPDLRDGEPFPRSYHTLLASLWADPNVQQAYRRRNENALPENLIYYFSNLDRLFEPGYIPTEQDILHARARTIGISETAFSLKNHEMLVVDVGGPKSERRKWIHCFQDATGILFLVSLSGYDQCLVEDHDANQMQDAMTIWDAICHSSWFNQTSIILLLNKNDLFEKKIPYSDIKDFFPDYNGEPGDANAGREYFKRRFGRLAQKANKKEREIYIHTVTATDTALLRNVMATVEGIILRNNFETAAPV